MKKIYNILNASIEVTAEEDVIKFVDNCVYEFLNSSFCRRSNINIL